MQPLYKTSEYLLPPILFLVTALALQLWQPVPFDADTAYHVVVGKLLREHGFLQAFPWTPFSILADTYADKELVFHLLFALLANLDWISASRTVGTIGGFAILTSLWLWLKQENVPRPWLWALLPLALSSDFVYRFSLVRPHLFSIVLALSVVFLAWRRSLLALFIVCVLYPLCYVGFPIALPLTLVVETARLISGRRAEWQTLTSALLGLSSGLLIHPNFPNILQIVWIQDVEILVNTAWAKLPTFELGSEFQAMNFTAFSRGGSLPALVLTCLALASALKRRRDEGITIAFAISALFFFALALATYRFVEYFILFATTATALAARHLKSNLTAPSLIMASLVYLVSVGLSPITMLHHRALDIPPAVGKTWRNIIPEGAQIFTASYGLTGELLLELPRRKFMVALDPYFFYKKDPVLYKTWFELIKNPPEMPVNMIKRNFNADWILCETRLSQYAGFLDAVYSDPGSSIVFINDLWVLFKLD